MKDDLSDKFKKKFLQKEKQKNFPFVSLQLIY